MKNSQNWSLTQQSIVANTNDLMEEIRLADLTNISMGIQISKKRDKLVSPLQKSLEEAFPENYGIFLYYDRDEY